jgi:RNA polymerase sigma factor (TIGR02999 family)
MTTKSSPDISGLLTAWSNGDEEALKGLIPAVYPELRRIARRQLGKRPPGHTLESAALANEAYLKLVLGRGIQCADRGHFFALCAQMIRGILVDHARHHGCAKRGGDSVRLPLEEMLLAKSGDVDVLALDLALESLSKVDPRKGRVVELRYFGGLSVAETADVLRISKETVSRDWQMARTWLFRELSAARPRH